MSHSTPLPHAAAYMFPKSGVQYPLNTFLNNPGSLFEHKFFTTLSLLMRNLTEQIQDYTHQYYSLPGDQFYNASVRLIDDETEASTELASSETVFSQEHPQKTSLHEDPVESFIRSLLTFYCILAATYFVNRTLLRKNRLVQYALEVILCYSFVLPILPFVAIFFGTIGICRLLIWFYIKLFYNGKRFMVSPEDGFWAYEEHGSSSSSIGLYMIKGKCNLDKIRKKVRETVAHPVVGGRMHRRLIQVMGFAVWEKVEMNTDDHVRIAEWPEGDKRRGSTDPWSDRDVLDFLSTFQDIPISSNVPAWEVIVIPDMRIAGEKDVPHYTCIFRMHHAMMDGISSANILHQVLGDKPFKFTIDPVEGGKKHGKIVKFLMYFAALAMVPRTGLVNGVLNLDHWYNRYFFPGKVLEGPKHFSWSRPLKMEGLKKIKDSGKSSVMNVLLSSLGGSYRAMEEGRRWKKGKESKLPEFYHALAPVAMLPYPDRHPRNGFSGVVLPVCVGKHSNPINRLRANDKEFKGLGIGVMDILGNFLLICMVGLMPNCLQKYFGSAVHAKMSLSNIPGSDEKIRIFGGDKIVEMGAWLPCKFTLGKLKN